LFTRENVLVGFVAWYLLTLCIIGLGLYVAVCLTGMNLDSVVHSAIVGGPVAGAITALTIPRLRQDREKK
jgi:membrane associated rhomboid family serine protease